MAVMQAHVQELLQPPLLSWNAYGLVVSSGVFQVVHVRERQPSPPLGARRGHRHGLEVLAAGVADLQDADQGPAALAELFRPSGCQFFPQAVDVVRGESHVVVLMGDSQDLQGFAALALVQAAVDQPEDCDPVLGLPHPLREYHRMTRARLELGPRRHRVSVELLGLAVREVCHGDCPFRQTPMISTAPREGSQAVRQAVGDDCGPLDCLHHMLRVFAGSLEPMEEFSPH